MIYNNIINIIKNYLFKFNYKLIKFKKKSNNLFKIFIDFKYSFKNKKKITIKDCEIIYNQLKYILYTENIKFNFLEISSPGLNIKIKKWNDFIRFINYEIILKLKTTPKRFKKNQKLFQGILLKPEKNFFKLKIHKKKFLQFTLNNIYKANLVKNIHLFKK
ncbi:hypothetical protein [Candidatus Zinderia endosymbiont of Aphrophora alni]|uniref:hypothetical protein n=1 Tax=Candidatus Zinderia endosymbiont of Aphrophora alni TaxID=3077951 RepID=UPI0030CDBC39